MKRVLIGCMGLGDAMFSEGIRNGVKSLSEKHGWTGKTFTHRDKSKILQFLKDERPGEVIAVGHSMGVDTLDKVAKTYAGTIDAMFSVASAYPETFPKNVKKVFWVTGDKDWRQFTIKGPSVERVKINASHIKVDNDKGLWSLVEREMNPEQENENMTFGSFVGLGKKIDDIDLPRIGASIGVGEDEIHAVIDVEARGSGFDSKGRPAMLFEPHIFHRLLKGAERTAAVKAGLAYPKWKRNYPKDSYPRLKKAIKINETAALMSASWGMGQIMGFNHKAAGFNTVQDMVAAFMRDEEKHLEGMVSFIKTNKLDGFLRMHDWAGFAKGYNGSGYKANKYDEKLAKSFSKWSRIKDTPWRETPPDSVTEIPDELPEIKPKHSLWGAIAALIANLFKGAK